MTQSVLTARWKRSLVLLSACFMVLFGPMSGQQKSALLLYKGSEEGVSSSRVATQVEPILKTLGFQTQYHDVEQGLPPSGSADLIVSWYASAKI